MTVRRHWGCGGSLALCGGFRGKVMKAAGMRLSPSSSFRRRPACMDARLQGCTPAWMQVIERRLERAAEVVEPRREQAAEVVLFPSSGGVPARAGW